MTEGRKSIGLNEIKLGVPVPHVADRILRELVGYRTAREIVDGGEFYGPQEAQDIGLVDHVLSLEETTLKAIATVQHVGSLPQEAFAAIKRNRTEPVERR